jgi:hypothetical protein
MWKEGAWNCSPLEGIFVHFAEFVDVPATTIVAGGRPGTMNLEARMWIRWVTSYHLRSIAVYEAVYYAAYHFRVAGEGVSTLQKDLMHNRGRVGSLARVELAQPAHVWSSEL